MTLLPVSVKIRDEVPSLKVNGWILDDGVLGGQVEDVRRALDILLTDGTARGLELSTEHSVPTPGTSKSAVWCPDIAHDDVDPLGLGVLPIRGPGFVHLGAPVGSPFFIQGKVKERVDKVANLLDKLPNLENAHSEFALLRSCFSLPKVSYLLRTCSPSPSCLSHWDLFDSNLRNTLNRILGCSLDEKAWLQAQLPISKGGLNMRSAKNHASAAYLSSLLGCKPLIEEVTPSLNLTPNTAEALDHLNGVLQVEAGEEIPEAVVIGMSQKQLSVMVDNSVHSNLLSLAESARDRARLHSVSLPHAGDYLLVVPSPSLGLQLRPAEFRTAVLYRLGMPIFAGDGTCVCLQLSDRFGDHAVGCAF